MRVELIITPSEARWSLRQGSRRIADYPEKDHALSVAESLAKAAAERGDRAVIKIAQKDGLREHRSFAPDVF